MLPFGPSEGTTGFPLASRITNHGIPPEAPGLYLLRIVSALLEDFRCRDLRCHPLFQECLHLGRVVMVALLQGVGSLRGDDAAIAIEHGEERVANTPLEFLAAERGLAVAEQ